MGGTKESISFDNSIIVVMKGYSFVSYSKHTEQSFLLYILLIELLPELLFIRQQASRSSTAAGGGGGGQKPSLKSDTKANTTNTTNSE